MEFVGGRHIWDKLHASIVGAAQRTAAVAYAGRNAAEILPMRRGDLVVVDGSDAALAAGSTHPAALAMWLEAGVQVWSLPGLHGKVVLLEHEDETCTVIVGSANMSDHSNNELIEAAIVTSDVAVCEAAREELDWWIGLADLVDAAWLSRAHTIYREPRRSDNFVSSRRRPRLDQRAPLWVGMSAPTDESLSPAAEAEFKQVVRRYGKRREVYWWQLNDGDESVVLPRHNVVLVNNPSDREQPVGQSTAWGPARIVRVVPGTRRHRPVAIMAVDAELAPRRFSVVKAAIKNAGGVLDWQRPLDGRAAESVYRLWFTHDAAA